MRLAGGLMGRFGDDTAAVLEVRGEHAVVSGEMGAGAGHGGLAVGWSDWLGRLMELCHGHQPCLCESLSMKLYPFDLVKCLGGEVAFTTA